MKRITMSKTACGPKYSYMQDREYNVSDDLASELEEAGACKPSEVEVKVEVEVEVDVKVEVEEPKKEVKVAKPKKESKFHPGKSK